VEVTLLSSEPESEELEWDPPERELRLEDRRLCLCFLRECLSLLSFLLFLFFFVLGGGVAAESVDDDDDDESEEESSVPLVDARPNADRVRLDVGVGVPSYPMM
jgi:hypothetical protein